MAVLRWIRKAMPQQKTTAESMADWMKRRREKAAKLFRRHHEAADAAEPAADANQERKEKMS